MTSLIDILSAVIWVVCAAAPWLLSFYLVAAVLYAFLDGRTCPYPQIWQSISGIKQPTEAKKSSSPVWKGLEYGLSILPGACISKMLLGILLGTIIMLTVPWDFSVYQERPVIEVLEFIMLVILAVLLRLPLCASLPGALALLAKGFSPGLALLYLLLSPASIIAYGERAADVSRLKYLKASLPHLLLLDVPLAILCLLLGRLFPGVPFSASQGAPLLGISVAEQVCGSILCAIMLRIAMICLVRKHEEETPV